MVGKPDEADCSRLLDDLDRARKELARAREQLEGFAEARCGEIVEVRRDKLEVEQLRRAASEAADRASAHSRVVEQRELTLLREVRRLARHVNQQSNSAQCRDGEGSASNGDLVPLVDGAGWQPPGTWGRRSVTKRSRGLIGRTLVLCSPRRREFKAVCGDLDPGWYLARYADVADRGLDPYLHYWRYGQFEGREKRPAQEGTAIGPDHRRPSTRGVRDCDPVDDDIVDAAWYLATYPDVADAGLDAAVHYELYGLSEGRHPNADKWQAFRDKVPLIVLVSGEPSTPGHKYRIEDLSTALPRARFDVQVVLDLEAADTLQLMRRAGYVWFWRCPWSAELQLCVDLVRGNGGYVIYDIDDLMFEPELAVTEVIDGIRTAGVLPELVREHFGAIRKAAEIADLVVTPTRFLARRAERLGVPSAVLTNGFSENYARTAADAEGRRSTDGILRIGYASGSKTHQRDFQLIAPVLAEVLRKYPEVRLVLFRETLILDEFPDLLPYAHRVEWRIMVPVDQLPFEYARFDINLAPVELANPFCESKSTLKYFEASLVGVPTIASATEPFGDAIDHGQTGLLAVTDADWRQGLEVLIDDPVSRAEMGRLAQENVYARFGSLAREQAVRDLLTVVVDDGVSIRSRLPDLAGPDLVSPPVEVAMPTATHLIREVLNGRTPRVTVVVPLYNYEQYLEEALDSIYVQTLEDIDLVIVDDQSTDNSLEVALRWLEAHNSRFARATILQNGINSGLALTRNAAVSYTRTPYFLPLDPDNTLSPNCLKRCLEELDATRAAVVYPIIEKFGEDSGFLGNAEWSAESLAMGNYIDAMALIRRDAWRSVGGYGPLHQGWEDYDLWCSFVEAGLEGHQLDEVLAQYRVHDSSMRATMTDLPGVQAAVVSQLTQRHPWLRLVVDDSGSR